MTNPFLNAPSRRIFLAGLLGTAATLAQAPGALADAPLTSVRPRVRVGGAAAAAESYERILQEANLSGKVGFVVSDARTGEVLERAGANEGLPPASVAKALTASYALETLGPGYRFTTQIVGTGTLTDGVLTGDLILVGGGDPTLSTDHLADLAAALKTAGVREVRGRFLIYEGALPSIETIDAGQPDYLGYSPAISGLNLNFNRVHFEWRKSGSNYTVTMDARSERYRPEVAMARMQVEARDGPTYTYRDREGRDDWTVRRNALGDGGARWLPVRKPGLYAADVFRTMARAQGIVLPAAGSVGDVPTGAVLVEHQSAQLQEILRDMLKFSTNVTAEVVGMTATIARGRRPSTLRESAREMNRWCQSRLNVRARLVDHSGLGDASRITAAQMARALVQFGAGRMLHDLMKDIPLTDVERREISGFPASVRAKTGTLNFVSALAGYETLSNGRVLAFAIFTGDTERRAALTRAQREVPDGARAWNRRAKRLQQRLLQRWAVSFAEEA